MNKNKLHLNISREYISDVHLSTASGLLLFFSHQPWNFEESNSETGRADKQLEKERQGALSHWISNRESNYIHTDYNWSAFSLLTVLWSLIPD